MVQQAKEMQKDTLKPSERILWLTDTYEDFNGVSTVLKSILHEIRLRNLPVDFLVCSHTLQPEDHLIVISPVAEFTLPVYRQQPFRIPNYLSVKRVFRRGGYNRIICSTEGPMGLAALWLKRVFQAETYFYLHTDWMIFAKEALAMEDAGLKRLQKMLRAYYRMFGNVIVLNTDHLQWLTGEIMGLDPARVTLTAHWADPIFSDVTYPEERIFPFDREKPVILYAGRISKEKGIMDFPDIIRLIRSVFPEVQPVIAGTGPAEEELKKAMPDACYLGWVDRQDLPALFRAADILLLPSRFDTFSCVVVEALSCGLPVVAYNAKGPKDIIEDSVNGYLVETVEEMAGKVVGFYLDPGRQAELKLAAVRRAGSYKADRILDRLLQDTGMIIESCLP